MSAVLVNLQQNYWFNVFDLYLFDNKYYNYYNVGR